MTTKKSITLWGANGTSDLPIEYLFNGVYGPSEISTTIYNYGLHQMVDGKELFRNFYSLTFVNGLFETREEAEKQIKRRKELSNKIHKIAGLKDEY